MSRTGYTNQPCHGCGTTGGRVKDELCSNCRNELKAARSMNESIRAAKDLRRHRLPWTYYSLPYIPHLSGVGGQAEDIYQTAFFDLARMVGQIDDPDAKWFSSELPAVVDGCKDCQGTAYIRPEVRDALNNAYQAVLTIVKVAFDNGKAEGQSMVLSLATGEMSIEQFNKRSVGEITRGGNK